MLVTPLDIAYEATVDVEVPQDGSCGLLLYYNEKGYAGITLNRHQITIYRDAVAYDIHPYKFGKKVSLRLSNRSNSMTLAVSRDGRRTWQVLATNIDVSGLHHNQLGSFLSLRIALLATGKGCTKFGHFDYHRMPDSQ